jgi:trans-2-enoyl-CoA reductase
MIAAPISLIDYTDIIGARSNVLPKFGGNEGVGVVEKVGQGVQLKVGDWVIPNNSSFGGTWRTHAVVDAQDVDVVPSSIPPEYAATLRLSPCTGFRLLNVFVKLQKGDVIVQNGANSQVGQTVIQLASQRGIKTVNIVRNRDDVKGTAERLKALGGTIVVDEDTLRTHQFRRLLSDLPEPKLALDGVGGIAATELTRLLVPGGTLVVYGNSSRQHLKFPASSFLFEGIRVRGFNMAQWVATHSKEERVAMVKELGDLVAAGKLKYSLQTHSFSDWNNAINKALEEQTNSKIVMLLEK